MMITDASLRSRPIPSPPPHSENVTKPEDVHEQQVAVVGAAEIGDNEERPPEGAEASASTTELETPTFEPPPPMKSKSDEEA